MLVVCGEAVLDLISDGTAEGYQARPGGSPVNVAVGCARLEVPTSLLARLGTGGLGASLRRHLIAAGVDLTLSVTAQEPVTLAVVAVDAAGQADYDFYVQGTADWAWQRSELPDPLPADVRALHVGSIASWRAPAAGLIAELVAREARRGAVLISFDPNVRPGLIADPGATRAKVQRLVGLAHVVKASVQDVSWLHPGAEPDAVALGWARAGPALVVLTDGVHGARAYRPDRPSQSVPAHQVPVADTVDTRDTVGAGDGFTAGLLGALADRGRLHRHGLDDLDESELGVILGTAAMAAALTCSRPGADPPTRAELAFALSRRRSAQPTP